MLFVAIEYFSQSYFLPVVELVPWLHHLHLCREQAKTGQRPHAAFTQARVPWEAACFADGLRPPQALMLRAELGRLPPATAPSCSSCST